MALINDMELATSSTLLEVAVGISKDGRGIDLKVCPRPTDDRVVSRVTVFRNKDEIPGVLRIRKRKDVVSFSVQTMDGRKYYEGNKLPRVIQIHKGVAYRVNRFLHQVLLKITDSEMDHWAKQVAKQMIYDSYRHARNMTTVK